MNTNTPAGKPRIVVRKSDHARLVALAQSSMDKDMVVGDELMAELERAMVEPDDGSSVRTIQMGRTATYQTDTHDARTVTLVYPGEADIQKNRISILTPIGVALLGLSEGQSISWTARDGHSHVLSVVTILD